MKTSELWAELCAEVSAEDWERLEKNDPALVISVYNRDTMLAMRRVVPRQEQEIEESKVRALRGKLEAYLDTYMKEQPQGHLWIILTSLYRTFILRQPMHPMKVVHIRIEWADNGPRYHCPSRSDDPDAVCAYCVCVP